MRRALALPAALALSACSGAVVPPADPAALDALAASGAPGAIATACGVSGAALGTSVETAAGYVIHDTAPGSTEPRVHHVTGFRDGCPRAVTAALVTFGDLSTYEAVHYLSHVGDTQATDVAYEAIKARVCGTPAGQPCGARLDRLAADTVFLSVYPVFGAEEHRDILLHAGDVAAQD